MLMVSFKCYLIMLMVSYLIMLMVYLIMLMVYLIMLMVSFKQRTFHTDKRSILQGTTDMSYNPTRFYQVFFNCSRFERFILFCH